MTAQEAIDAYTQKFGGWPYFLFMAASDSVIIKAAQDALQTGKPIQAPEDSDIVL